MTKFKKVLVGLMAVAMMLSVNTSVFASEGKSIEPRAAICGYCSNGQQLPSTTYGSWQRNGTTRKCTDLPFGQDLQEFREKTTKYKCNYCGVSGGSTTSTETRWVCYGHR